MAGSRFRAVIIAAAVFCVVCIAGCASGNKLSLEKSEFAPGEEIQVTYSASGSFEDNAWIGIIPSDIPHGSEDENDKHDITYQYLKKSTAGTLTFTAPSQKGKYDFRMHDTDNNGKEVASVSFVVEGEIGPSSLSLSKTRFKPGEEIEVNFTAPATFARTAWVGVIPSDVPHGSEDENDKHDLAYQYLEKRTSGTLTFTAPKQRGSYDLRMHNTDQNGVETTSVTFTVK